MQLRGIQAEDGIFPARCSATPEYWPNPSPLFSQNGRVDLLNVDLYMKGDANDVNHKVTKLLTVN